MENRTSNVESILCQIIINIVNQMKKLYPGKYERFAVNGVYNYLVKSRLKNISTNNGIFDCNLLDKSVSHLHKNSPNPDKFFKICDELISKRFPYIEPFLYFLYIMSKDNSMIVFINEIFQNTNVLVRQMSNNSLYMDLVDKPGNIKIRSSSNINLRSHIQQNRRVVSADVSTYFNKLDLESKSYQSTSNPPEERTGSSNYNVTINSVDTQFDLELDCKDTKTVDTIQNLNYKEKELSKQSISSIPKISTSFRSVSGSIEKHFSIFATIDECVPHYPQFCLGINNDVLSKPQFSMHRDSFIDNVQEVPVDRYSEKFIVNELFDAFHGIEGQFFKLILSELDDTFNETIMIVNPNKNHNVLLEYAQLFSPILNDIHILFLFVTPSFVSNKSLAIQPLSTEINAVIEDFFIFLQDLQACVSEPLTLQTVWLKIQSVIPLISLLANLVKKIFNCKDFSTPSIINTLHENIRLGFVHDQTCSVFLKIVRKASEPFFFRLNNWLMHGKIPYDYGMGNDIFMVQKDKSKTNKKQKDFKINWSSNYNYTIIEKCVPRFLSGIISKIIDTGKYINIFNEYMFYANKNDSHFIQKLTEKKNFLDNSKFQKIFIDCDNFDEKISIAHEIASNRLLHVLQNSNLHVPLKTHFDTIYHFFLLNRCDFLIGFMDTAMDELKNPVNKVSLSRLDILMQQAIYSCCINNMSENNINVVLLDFDLPRQLQRIFNVNQDEYVKLSSKDTDSKMVLSTLEAISLNYIIPWPHSLILNEHNICLYQLIFRHLFYCNYVEQLLLGSWKNMAHRSRRKIKEFVEFDKKSNLLRYCMLQFVRSFYNYLTTDVLEIKWASFQKTIQTITTIDRLMEAQNDFLINSMQMCLLLSSKTLQSLHAIFMICVTFTNYMNRFNHIWFKEDFHESTTDSSQNQSMDNPSVQPQPIFDSIDAMECLKETGNNFFDALSVFIKHLNHDLSKEFNRNLNSLLQTILPIYVVGSPS
ncbi:Gamma-tubulin complex component 2 [Intoshia linei]|uniref:Gamma-tubulin complex component n=1 Tax=Intoshia linei TaxID=1819745 RepID=A0A177B7S2_9BILA|nr:Gamma-tubulin complex component 2 [Intoshia linei]